MMGEIEMDKRKRIQLSKYVSFLDYKFSKIDSLTLCFKEIERYLLAEIMNKELKVDLFKIELTAIIHEDCGDER
jgi:hypothetical protein